MAKKNWKKLDRNLQRNFINKLIGQQIINRHFLCPAEKFIHVLFEMLIDHLHVIFTVANHSKGNRCLPLVRVYCCPRNPPPGCPYSTSDRSSSTFLNFADKSDIHTPLILQKRRRIPSIATNHHRPPQAKSKSTILKKMSLKVAKTVQRRPPCKRNPSSSFLNFFFFLMSIKEGTRKVQHGILVRAFDLGLGRVLSQSWEAPSCIVLRSKCRVVSPSVITLFIIVVVVSF